MERVNITIGPLTFDHADYDAEGDVLYLHVGAPQAGEGEEKPEGHIVRYAPDTNRVVGLTVLGALAHSGARRVALDHGVGDDRDDRRGTRSRSRGGVTSLPGPLS
jgi:hypothetical protein